MIGTKELLKLVDSIKLVENLSERELTNPEGSGFDLRVGEVHKIKEGEAFLGVTDRFTPETEVLAKHPENKEFTLKPGEYVLVTTMEKVNLPFNINGIWVPRSTLQRSGLILRTASTAPGYQGKLTFGLLNAGKSNFRFELGARIAHGYFFYTGENVSTYRGQWQGGRVSTQGKTEKQV